MVSVEMLHRLLICDAESGNLWWRERTPGLFVGTTGRSPEHACANWNARHALQLALNSPSKVGYLRGNVLNRNQYKHRVIWAMTFGDFPEYIDHANGDRQDNRLCNLRSVTAQQNRQNCGISARNSSGRVGVEFCKRTKKWKARIGVDRQCVHLGTFASFSEATRARIDAEQLHGFHPNHGRQLT